jgi:hypothetical protein
MPGMKVTLSAAMRARDVSRPHAEHETLAAAGDTATPAGRGPQPPAPPAGRGATDGGEASRAVADIARAVADPGPGGGAKGRRPHRRRRRR